MKTLLEALNNYKIEEKLTWRQAIKDSYNKLYNKGITEITPDMIIEDLNLHYTGFEQINESRLSYNRAKNIVSRVLSEALKSGNQEEADRLQRDIDFYEDQEDDYYSQDKYEDKIADLKKRLEEKTLKENFDLDEFKNDPDFATYKKIYDFLISRYKDNNAAKFSAFIQNLRSKNYPKIVINTIVDRLSLDESGFNGLITYNNYIIPAKEKNSFIDVLEVERKEQVKKDREEAKKAKEAARWAALTPEQQQEEEDKKRRAEERAAKKAAIQDIENDLSLTAQEKEYRKYEIQHEQYFNNIAEKADELLQDLGLDGAPTIAGKNIIKHVKGIFITCPPKALRKARELFPLDANKIKVRKDNKQWGIGARILFDDINSPEIPVEIKNLKTLKATHGTNSVNCLSLAIALYNAGCELSDSSDKEADEFSDELMEEPDWAILDDMDTILADDSDDLIEKFTEDLSLEETYSEDELDKMIGKTYNQQKIQDIIRQDKYGAKRLYAKTTCTKCGRSKKVFLSNLVNDPDKYGSCICSDTNVDSKIAQAKDLYSGKKVLSSNTSGYTGVSYVKTYAGQPYDKWRAYIEIDGTRHYLGDFDSKLKAIKARKVAGEKGIKWYKANKNRLMRDVRKKSKKYRDSKYRDRARKTINLSSKDLK